MESGNSRQTIFYKHDALVGHKYTTLMLELNYVLMKKIITLIFIIASLQSQAQQFLPIWPDGKKPNFNGIVIKDSITNRVWRVGTPGFYTFIVQPEENAGTAVLICPGGGYERLACVLLVQERERKLGDRVEIHGEIARLKRAVAGQCNSMLQEMS